MTSDEFEIEEMVSRFLRWKMPDDFCPDGGISFAPGNKHIWPVGTNLLTASQAKDMVRFMMGYDD